MEEEITCCKCGKMMEIGFVPDLNEASTNPAFWIRGFAEQNWFGVTKLPGPRYQVYTYRCKGCGYLESYAKRNVKKLDPAM